MISLNGGPVFIFMALRPSNSVSAVVVLPRWSLVA